MSRHCMIDLETMGLAANAAIVSIGATIFDQHQIVDRFYSPVNLDSCLNAGLSTTESTVKWWSEQSNEARNAWKTSDAPTVQIALENFYKWLKPSDINIKQICPWGNGVDFDMVILKSAYEAINLDAPWMFYNQFCFRSLKNMFPVESIVRRGTHHNALDDAEHQTNHLHKILKVHNIKLP